MVTTTFLSSYFYMILHWFSVHFWVFSGWLVRASIVVCLSCWIWLCIYMLCFGFYFGFCAWMYLSEHNIWESWLLFPDIFACFLAHGCHLKWGSLHSWFAWFPICSSLSFYSGSYFCFYSSITGVWGIEYHNWVDHFGWGVSGTHI